MQPRCLSGGESPGHVNNSPGHKDMDPPCDQRSDIMTRRLHLCGAWYVASHSLPTRSPAADIQQCNMGQPEPPVALRNILFFILVLLPMSARAPDTPSKYSLFKRQGG